MADIRVVTDSAACLDPEEAGELGIEIVPLRVHLGKKVYREGVDIQPEAFLKKLSFASEMPTLSPPPVAELKKTYERLSRSADEIISIHVSRRLCDTIKSARQASQEYVGRCRITTVDSMVFGLGQAVLARKAVGAARAGLASDEIIHLVRGLIQHIYALFYTDTLTYLEQGGRIGQAQAILGTMLGIKPILTLEDGDIVPLEKVQTTESALEKLAEFVAEFSSVEEIAILESEFSEDTVTLLQLLEPLLEEGREVPVMTYPPSLAVHLGPSARGVLVIEGD